MTIQDLKQKTFSLIEEYDSEISLFTDDEDLLGKVNGCINMIATELSRYRKKLVINTITITEEDSKTIFLNEIEGFFQLKEIDLVQENYKLTENILRLKEDYVGSFDLYFYKTPNTVPLNYPVIIDGISMEKEQYESITEMDLDSILIEIAPYGIAADLLKLDIISNYGQYFYSRYASMLSTIDNRYSGGSVSAEGGYGF